MAEKPVVMLLSLNKEGYFDQMYSNLLTHLGTKASIEESNDARATINYLGANKPAAILITDAALIQPKSGPVKSVLEELRQYVQAGGTAVFCCHLSSFVPVGALGGFFSDAFGLPWQAGGYFRSTFALHAAAAESIGSKAVAAARRLPSAYSQKAVQLCNVEGAQAVYLPTAESELESLVFSGESVADVQQTPVAWAKVGQGWVGYVGDVNAESESDEVILAMCGL